MSYTHKKTPLKADCFCYTGDNYKKLEQWCSKYGLEADTRMRGKHTILRAGRSITGLPIGSWVVKQQNGELKVYTEDMFKLLYEEL